MDFNLKWDDAAVRAAVKNAAQQAGREGGAELLARSNERVPVDTGELRSSGTVTPTDDGSIISYDTPYAVKQHEDMALNHPRGGQAKFLEATIDQDGDLYLQKLADLLDKALR